MAPADDWLRDSMPDFDAPPGFNAPSFNSFRNDGFNDRIGVNRLTALDPIGANRMPVLAPIGTPRRSGSLAGSPNGLGHLNGSTSSNSAGVYGGRAVSNGNGNGTHSPANGNPSPVRDSNIAHLRMRYNQLRNAESMKDALLEDLLDKCSELQERNEALDRQCNSDGLDYRTIAEQLTDMLNRQTLTVLLVDGNTLIFQSHLLRDGSKGGQKAADLLKEKLMQWAAANCSDVEMQGVVVRVYANVKALAEKCRKANLVPSVEVFESFVHGFNCSNNGLFDFIDVGATPDGAVTKMDGELQYHADNYQTGHILLGCGDDESFSQMLESFITNGGMPARVSLLELEPFENAAMAKIPLEKYKIEGIFRDSHKPLHTALELQTDMARKDSRNVFNPQSGVFTPQQSPFSARPAVPAIGCSPAPSFRADLTRTNSHASSTAFSETPSATTNNTGGGGWANIARTSAHLPLKDLTQKPSTPKETKVTGPVVRQNKYGQRIDVEMEYNHEKVYELKKMKYCNQHYIGRGCCHHSAGNGACPHRHEPKLSKDDLKWLRVVARETVCKKGTTCTEFDCIYGHHCPYPKVQEGSQKGVACINGDNCRFGSEMHGMDTVTDKIIRPEDVEY